MTTHRTSSVIAVLALLGGLLSGCANQPFSEGAQVAIGVIEESFGDQYTLSAEQLTVEWTFNEAAPLTLSFTEGAVTYDGSSLEPGCYSGESESGALLEYDRAQDVEFATPDSDPACEELP